jgi:hypothetical protein
MSQIFGEFIENFSDDNDSLELSFTPSARPMKQRWRNNRLSAIFVAEYFSSFLPIDDDDPHREKRIKESKNAVSYVGNELLENALKFNDDRSNYKVKFGIYFLESPSQVIAVLCTKNSINSQGVEKFQAFLEKLLASDPNELYIEQIEKTTEDEHSKASGLGFLTMINDYSAKLGWKFETMPENPDVMVVTTMAQIPL